nr:MAG TPA: hypothetical protein [Caudoviricetes sp.]
MVDYLQHYLQHYLQQGAFKALSVTRFLTFILC